MVAGSFYIKRYVEEKDSVNTNLLLIAGGCISLGWMLVVFPRIFTLVTLSVSSLTFYWLVSVPLIPFGVLLLQMWERLAMVLKPKSLAEQLAEEEKRLARKEEYLSRRADLGSRQVLSADLPGLQLGTFIKGDMLPPHLGVKRVGRFVVLEEDVLNRHIFLLGTTGAGKTETIKRLIHDILKNTGRDLFIVDGKGDEGLAQDVRSLAWQYGRGNSPVFRLGHGRPGATYNGFQGDALDIYNRLASMVGVQQAEGNAQFYADINRDILQLVCLAPDGPPRSFDDLRRRLNVEWLRDAWRGDLVEMETVEELTDRDLQGLVLRLRPLMRVFAPMIAPAGFSLEETACAIFSLRTQSVSDTASRFLDFFIEDLKDFTGKRQKRPGVLVIDEFGTFKNQNIVDLLQLARSAKMGVILATQDVATLGDEMTRQKILANCVTKILMASDFPEYIAELAGTKYQVESSIQHEGGEATGMGSARIQHAFKIDMNEAAKLQTGEAFLIRQRHAVKLKVSVVGDIAPAPAEEIPPAAKPSKGPSGPGIDKPTSKPIEL